MKQQWQGYQHINGTFQAKPAHIFDVADAQSSPMVRKVSKVVMAESREEALELIEADLLSTPQE